MQGDIVSGLYAPDTGVCQIDLERAGHHYILLWRCGEGLLASLAAGTWMHKPQPSLSMQEATSLLWLIGQLDLKAEEFRQRSRRIRTGHEGPV